MTSTRIKLLRHGQPEGEGCFRGHTDFPLTQRGFKQMHMATRHLNDIDIVVSSPLIRCAAFATRYCQTNAVEFYQDDAWKELNFGHWDGREKSEIWESEPSVLTQFWGNPWETKPPNGENLENYDQRISYAWSALLERHKGKHILLVTHGGVIKQLIRQNLELPKTATYLQRLVIPYAALINLTVYHDEDGTLWPQLEMTSEITIDD